MAIVAKVKGDLGKLKALADKIPRAARVKIGVIDDPDIAKYAAYNEFGWVQRVTGRQSGFLRNNFGVNVMPGYTLSSPPRPFLRATATDKAGEWKKTLGDGIAALGVDHIPKVLEAVGRQAQADVQSTIKNNGTGKTKFPERSDLTLQIYEAKDAQTSKGRKRRIESGSGSQRRQALFKTGTLLSAIAYEVEVKK